MLFLFPPPHSLPLWVQSASHQEQLLQSCELFGFCNYLFFVLNKLTWILLFCTQLSVLEQRLWALLPPLVIYEEFTYLFALCIYLSLFKRVTSVSTSITDIYWRVFNSAGETCFAFSKHVLYERRFFWEPIALQIEISLDEGTQGEKWPGRLRATASALPALFGTEIKNLADYFRGKS